MEELSDQGRLAAAPVITADDCFADARALARWRLFELRARPVAYEVVLGLVAVPQGGSIVELRLAQLSEAGT